MCLGYNLFAKEKLFLKIMQFDLLETFYSQSFRRRPRRKFGKVVVTRAGHLKE